MKKCLFVSDHRIVINLILPPSCREKLQKWLEHSLATVELSRKGTKSDRRDFFTLMIDYEYKGKLLGRLEQFCRLNNLEYRGTTEAEHLRKLCILADAESLIANAATQPSHLGPKSSQ